MNKLIVAIIVVTLSFYINSSPDDRQQSTTVQQITREEEMLKLINDEREDRWLKPLIINKELSKLAKERAEDMANNNYFDHRNVPQGIIENIHAGNSNADNAMFEFMASEQHKLNIVNDSFNYIGIGYAENLNSKYIYYWCQLFK